MGTHLDGSSQVGVSRLEVIEGPTGPRRRTPAERTRIATESMMPGVRVAVETFNEGVLPRLSGAQLNRFRNSQAASGNVTAAIASNGTKSKDTSRKPAPSR